MSSHWKLFLSSLPQTLSPFLSGPVIYISNEFDRLCPYTHGNLSFSFPVPGKVDFRCLFQKIKNQLVLYLLAVH